MTWGTIRSIFIGVKIERIPFPYPSTDFTMTSYDFSPSEIDERAFTIFLIEGIYFFLEQDPPLRNSSVIDYCTRLWNRWIQMSREEKAPFYDRAREEMRRLRRNRRNDIYRSVIRDDIQDEPDHTRRRWNNQPMN